MKSTERTFQKGTTLQLKGKQVKNIYFVISGTIKEQFDNFYYMRGIGNMLNPYDFLYKEESKCVIKTMTDTKLMQIQDHILD